MTLITARKLNEVHYGLNVDRGVAQELSEFFAFRPEGYQFMPAYKNKVWDGFVRLYDTRTNRLPVGHRSYLERFCSERDYQLEIADDDPPDNCTVEDMREFAKTLDLRAGGKRIEPREYQLEAAAVAVRDRRRILLSPTASGKSLILYLIIRYLHDAGLARKSIMVVPSVSLVKQMIGDFEDYSSANGWPVDEMVHGISAGKSKTSDTPLTITTWQSVFKLPSTWFKDFDSCFMDEAHTAKAKSLVKIMESMTRARYRIGTTGTIDDSQVNRLVLIGAMGDIYRVTSTRELIDEGTLAEFKVHAMHMDYPEHDRKACKDLDYRGELDYIIDHVTRNDVVVNITKTAPTKNGLVLFSQIRHGQAMFAAIRDEVDSKRQVFYIDGNTPADDRERIRKTAEKIKGAVIVASYGVYSTGINIKNLHYAVFASPTKSKIRSLQSIGRVLRKPPDGSSAALFDLIDDLSWKSKESFAVRHARQRFKTYMEERFRVNTHRIKIR